MGNARAKTKFGNSDSNTKGADNAKGVVSKGSGVKINNRGMQASKPGGGNKIPNGRAKAF